MGSSDKIVIAAYDSVRSFRGLTSLKSSKHEMGAWLFHESLVSSCYARDFS